MVKIRSRPFSGRRLFQQNFRQDVSHSLAFKFDPSGACGRDGFITVGLSLWASIQIRSLTDSLGQQRFILSPAIERRVRSSSRASFENTRIKPAVNNRWKRQTRTCRAFKKIHRRLRVEEEPRGRLWLNIPSDREAYGWGLSRGLAITCVPRLLIYMNAVVKGCWYAAYSP